MRKPQLSTNFLTQAGIGTVLAGVTVYGATNAMREYESNDIHTQLITNTTATTRGNLFRILPSQDRYYNEVEMRAEYVRSIQRIVDQFGGSMQYMEHGSTDSIAALITIDVDQASARTIFEILRTPGSSRVRITFNGIDSSYGTEMPSPDHRAPVQVTEANTGAQVYFKLDTDEVGFLTQVLQSATEDTALPLAKFGMSHQSDVPMSESAANALIETLPRMNIQTEIALLDIRPDDRCHPDSPFAASTAQDFKNVTSRYCAVNGKMLVTSQLAGVSETCLPSQYLREKMQQNTAEVVRAPSSDSLTLTTPPPPPSRE